MFQMKQLNNKIDKNLVESKKYSPLIISADVYFLMMKKNMIVSHETIKKNEKILRNILLD